jgi:hypothetical protein
VVVVVGGVVGAGAVVVGGEVVAGTLERPCLPLLGALVVAEGTVVVGAVVLEAPEVTAVVGADELELSPASEIVAGAVWKLSTPARPSSVPPMTKGERLMVGARSSEGELL